MSPTARTTPGSAPAPHPAPWPPCATSPSAPYAWPAPPTSPKPYAPWPATSPDHSPYSESPPHKHKPDFDGPLPPLPGAALEPSVSANHDPQGLLDQLVDKLTPVDNSLEVLGGLRGGEQDDDQQ